MPIPAKPGVVRPPSLWILVQVALFLGAATAWLYPLSSSLWLDETVTAWVISGGLPRLLHRAVHFQSSPVYYYLPWLATKLLGTSEAALRLPSLVCMAGATVLLWRLATLLFDTETGIFAALLFASLKNVAFAAVDARPYAASLVVVIGSMFFLIRWLRERGAGNAVGYVLLTGLTVYFHVLFSIMIVVQLCWILLFVRAGGKLTGRQLLWLSAGVALVLVPYLTQFLSLVDRRDTLSWATNRSLWSAVAPLARLAGIVGLGLLVLALAGRLNPLRRLDIERPVLWGLLIWAFLPPSVLYDVTLVSPYKLFVGRYFLCAVPGFVLLLAGVLRSLQPAGVRRVAALALAAVLLVTGFERTHRNENWRDAVQAAQRIVEGSPSTVFIMSGLIESDRAEWLHDPESRSYLLAPLCPYPIRARAVPLPLHLNPETSAYLDELARSTLPGLERFVMIENNWTHSRFLEDRLRSCGFTSREAGRFGAVAVLVYER
jgi:mannosyltransferase